MKAVLTEGDDKKIREAFLHTIQEMIEALPPGVVPGFASIVAIDSGDTSLYSNSLRTFFDDRHPTLKSSEIVERTIVELQRMDDFKESDTSVKILINAKTDPS